MGSKNDISSAIDRFAEVLFLKDHAERGKRTGIYGYPLLVGDHKRLIRSNALRWLVRERPKLASLLMRAPTSPKSLDDLNDLLTPEYGGNMAGALAPIVAQIGIDGLIDKARTADLADEEKLTVLTQLGLRNETVPLLRKMIAQRSGEGRQICKNNLAYALSFGDEASLTEAKSLIESVLEKASDAGHIAAAKDTLAIILLKMGDLEKAMKAIEHVMRILVDMACDHPLAHYHCYLICKGLGLTERAERELRIACEMVGGPGRISPKVDLRECLIGEDEITELIDEWLLSNSVFDRISSLLEVELRPAVGRTVPSSERDVSDRIETILRSAGLRVDRENIHVRYSLKTYVPDIALLDALAAVEVKLTSKSRTPKRIIAEINDDKVAYLSKFARILFVVYDLYQIEDVEKFKVGIEQVGVKVVIVKH